MTQTNTEIAQQNAAHTSVSRIANKKIWNIRVAAFIAFHESPISSKTCAFCSCNTAFFGSKDTAASHFPRASWYFPS